MLRSGWEMVACPSRELAVPDIPAGVDMDMDHPRWISGITKWELAVVPTLVPDQTYLYPFPNLQTALLFRNFQFQNTPNTWRPQSHHPLHRQRL